MTENEVFDQEVTRIIALMSELDPASKDYIRAAQSLNILCEARSKKPANRIEYNTVLAELSRFLIVGLILNHERVHVISTRAVGFIRK